MKPTNIASSQQIHVYISIMIHSMLCKLLIQCLRFISENKEICPGFESNDKDFQATDPAWVSYTLTLKINWDHTMSWST